jgi:type I restriction enzyme S subunit
VKRDGVTTEAVTSGVNSEVPLRDSGIPWLGHVPAHWEVKKLSRVTQSRCDGPFGSGLKSEHYTDEGIRVIRLQNIGFAAFDDEDQVFIDADYYAELGDHDVHPGDLLVAGLGDTNNPVGRACRAPDHLGPAMVKADCFRYRLERGKADSQFMAYQMSVTAQALSGALASGVTRPRMNLSLTSDRMFAFPPLDEQIAIAEFLVWKTGQIDTLIVRKKELLKRLQEKRLAIIAQAVTRGLKATAPLRDSGVPWIGYVPEHWEVKRIKFIARIGNGSTPSRENPLYWDDGYYPWLNSSVVNQEAVTMADQFVTADALRECHLPIVQPPAVLIGITGEGKTRGMATTLLFEATINQHLAYVKPDPTLVKVNFLRRVFDNAYPYLRSESDGGGSTKGAITCEQIAELSVPVPPVNEQEAIAAHLEVQTQRIDRLAVKLEGAVESLTEYRTALIAAATTGKIDVRSVQTPHFAS